MKRNYPSTQASISCFRERVGEWGENEESTTLTTTLFSFSRLQTPHGQCNRTGKYETSFAHYI